jgi:anti-sigma factor RsiW
MNCERVRHGLEDYVAGQLDALEAGEVRRLLTVCVECRAAAAALQVLRPLVAELPRDVPPARSLWTDIERRVASRRGRRAWVRRALPVAAAIVLVLLSSLLLRRVRPVSPGVAGLPASVAGQVSAYRVATAELQAALRERGAAVSGVTAVLDRDLGTLDDAIEESGVALRREPANPALQALLLSAYRKKLGLLRQAMTLVVEG